MDIYSEAKEVLDSSDLMNTLKDLGEVIVGGSYAYKTLVDRDIDLDVIIPPITELSYELRSSIAAKLLAITSLRSLQVSDPHHFQKFSKHNIDGFWFGPKLVSTLTGKEWNIDIWFMHKDGNHEEDRALTERLMNLSDEQRQIIIAIKQEALARGMKEKGETSVKIYRAVLERGVKNYQEFIAEE